MEKETTQPNEAPRLLPPLWVDFDKDVSQVREQLCSDCFTDYGLRSTANAYGEESQSKCPRCGSISGKRLDDQLLAYVLHKFFVQGSSCGRHMPPVLTSGTTGPDGDIRFTPALQKDYELLKKLTGFRLMRNAPNLVRMGISSLRTTIETGLGICNWGDRTSPAEVEEAFGRIVDFPIQRELSPDRLIFRIRTAPRRPSDPSEYDAPPTGLAKANRLNLEGFRVFYGAFDIETCAFEMKPSLEAIVNEQMFVATFRPTRTLRIFDLLGYPFDMDGPDGPGGTHHFLKSIFFPQDHDYRISQELAVRIASRGFDGILYPSAYSYIREASAYPNLVLFGAPLANEVVELLSINKLSFRGVSFACEPAPVLIDPL